jgi:hypothetical protein
MPRQKLLRCAALLAVYLATVASSQSEDSTLHHLDPPAPLQARKQGTAVQATLAWPQPQQIENRINQLWLDMEKKILDNGTNAAAESAAVAANGPGAPLPRFSVIIMNWSRPNNTRAIAQAYATDPLYEPFVSQIILLHLRPDSYSLLRDLNHPRITHVVDYEADATYGLSVRFLGCLMAIEDEVIIQARKRVTTANPKRHTCCAHQLLKHICARHCTPLS